jgi:hypothetical protein
MPGVTGSFSTELKEFSDRLPEYCADQAAKLAELGAAAARRNAPVGREIDEHGRDVGESGELRRSIKAGPVRRNGVRYEASFGSKLKYASYVNDGTRAHIIRPRTKKALRFFDKGKEVLSAEVHHPGFRGAHFMERGLAEAEREWGEQAESDLRILASEVFR